MLSNPNIIVTNFNNGTFQIQYPSSCINYTVTISAFNNLAACSTSVTVSGYACCPCTPGPNDVVISGTQQSPYLASQLIANYPQYFSGNTYTNTQGILYINGFFDINVPLTISGSQVRMGGGAKISLVNTSFTISGNSRLAAGCNYMWDAYMPITLMKTL